MNVALVVAKSFFWTFLLTCIPCCNGEAVFIPYDIRDAVGKPNLVPVVIVGSGPAGLSAALYTCRANFQTLVIEGKEPGGQLTKTSYVENWPGIKRRLGHQAIATLREQAQSFGAEFLPDFVERVDLSSWPFVVYTKGGLQLHAMTLMIGTGATPRYLGIKGEKEYWGNGVTACAICDAPLYKGDEVVVVGGGDAAVEEAIQLASYAKKITVLVRKGKMRATWAMQDRLKGYPNISIIYNVEIQEILGDGDFVTGVRLLNSETGEISDFSTHGVFLAIGRIPNSQIFSDFLDVDSTTHILVKGRSQATSKSGVFAAGDVADPTYKQAGIAAGDGIKAGIDISRYLADLGLSEIFLPELKPYLFKGGEDGNAVDKLESISTEKDFENKVINSEQAVVLDFFTEYCPSCLQMLPKIAHIAKGFNNKIKVYKVDAEQAEALTKRLGVAKVPSLLLFKNGELVKRYTREMSREEIQLLFEEFSL